MFQVDKTELSAVLQKFGISEEIIQTSELLRYNYDDGQVRLMLKVDFQNREPVVVKFKNEHDVSADLIEAQTTFSEHLAVHGIPTARFMKAGDGYVLQANVGGCDVLVTCESFCAGEIKAVDVKIAEKTGRLLAQTHNIAERDDVHVDGDILFDLFAENDLFSYELFAELTDAINDPLLPKIRSKYREHMAALEFLRKRPRYATQGDISLCNLFLSGDGIGLFDFNHSGDNILFCDAIIQAVFEAKLMEYDKPLDSEYSREIFKAFLSGYEHEREFTDEERAAIPHITAVVNAFWLIDLCRGNENLKVYIENKDRSGIDAAINRVWDRLNENG